MSLLHVLVVNYVVLVGILSSGIYSLLNLIHHKSIPGGILLLVGVFTAFMLLFLLLKLDSVRRKKELISGYLTKFSKCRFIKYHVNDYFTDNPFFADNYNKYPFVADKNYNLRLKNTHIYVVKRGESLYVPTQLAAYQLSIDEDDPCYLFVRDEPDQITITGKFFIIHEIGHASKSHAVVDWLSRIAWKVYAFQLPWILINQNLDPISIGLTGVYVLLLSITFPIHKKIISAQQMISELNADTFAVRFFYQYDKQALNNYIDFVGEFPRDTSLDIHENMIRYINLLERQDELNNPELKPAMLVFPKYSPYVVLPLALLIPLMGYFGREPSTSLVCITPIYLVMLLAVLVWVSEKGDRLQKEIDQILESEGQVSSEEIS